MSIFDMLLPERTPKSPFSNDFGPEVAKMSISDMFLIANLRVDKICIKIPLSGLGGQNIHEIGMKILAERPCGAKNPMKSLEIRMKIFGKRFATQKFFQCMKLV